MNFYLRVEKMRVPPVKFQASWWPSGFSRQSFTPNIRVFRPKFACSEISNLCVFATYTTEYLSPNPHQMITMGRFRSDCAYRQVIQVYTDHKCPKLCFLRARQKHIDNFFGSFSSRLLPTEFFSRYCCRRMKQLTLPNSC